MTDLTRRERVSLGTKEIAKRVRVELKAEFPGFKFSVRKKSYSGGSSITVSIMKADRKMVIDFDNIHESQLSRYLDTWCTLDTLRERQESGYHQISENLFYSDFDSSHWNNGVFLTYQGHSVLTRVVQIVHAYHRNDSDIQRDYYSVNFHFSLQLGRCDTPMIDGTGYIADPELDSRITAHREAREAAAIIAKAAKAEKDRIDSLERNSHVERDRRAVAEIKSIMSATAIIGANGFEVMTPEAKAKKILEIEEVRQSLKVSSIDWKKAIFEL